MKIILNGKETDTSSKSLSDLLDEKSIPKGKIAIEVNGEVVVKSLINEFAIKENDIVEIITFVGGG